ncbi:hypothetical protein EDD74_11924 [Faecalimonas umbilicata]|uniref:DUF3927 domain-containing protein n=1 Tax=Faecalimonas umbilicata TaxID=1912855 RepID=A0A4R3JKP6_9FIRM|nr:hypothetical protein [Faecalimonas umbilicata]TCS66126.1 hypothetical protein EDD74_11924 [Faecalimonas umbilicata]GBU06555.1 hypothetical protein FAEUMB_30960 [Faecalimonas umbilicata]
MRKTRRTLVVLLVLLICLTVQRGLNILNGIALIIDAIMIIVLATVELRRSRDGK